MMLRQSWLAVSDCKSTVVLACSPDQVASPPIRGRCEFRLEISLGSGRELELEEIWVAISYEAAA